MMSETIFYLFRHGQTDWNKERRFQGHSDIPLNPTGHEQAQGLISIFNNLEIKRIISSDLSRARQTAQVLVDAHGFEIHHDERLRETHMGEIEGISGDEVIQRFGDDAISKWRSGTPESMNFAFPGGETKLAVRERARAALHHWSDLYPGENLGISSHGGVVRLLLTLASGNDNDFYIGNCEVYRLHYRKDENSWWSDFVCLK